MHQPWVIAAHPSTLMACQLVSGSWVACHGLSSAENQGWPSQHAGLLLSHQQFLNQQPHCTALQVILVIRRCCCCRYRPQRPFVPHPALMNPPQPPTAADAAALTETAAAETLPSLFLLLLPCQSQMPSAAAAAAAG
jgi:hypothetical protein